MVLGVKWLDADEYVLARYTGNVEVQGYIWRRQQDEKAVLNGLKDKKEFMRV